MEVDFYVFYKVFNLANKNAMKSMFLLCVTAFGPIIKLLCYFICLFINFCQFDLRFANKILFALKIFCRLTRAYKTFLCFQHFYQRGINSTFNSI